MRAASNTLGGNNGQAGEINDRGPSLGLQHRRFGVWPVSRGRAGWVWRRLTARGRPRSRPLTEDGLRRDKTDSAAVSALRRVRQITPNSLRDIPLKGLSELSTLAWSADGKSFFATTSAVSGSSLFHVSFDGKYHLLYRGPRKPKERGPLLMGAISHSAMLSLPAMSGS